MTSFSKRLVFIGILFISLTSPGQDCSVKYFQDNFHHLGLNSFARITILPDNALLLTSIYNYTGTELVKLTSAGDTIWTKVYINPTDPVANRYSKTINDVDGNLFSLFNTKYLTELDTAGNVLSTLYFKGLEQSAIRDIGVFPDGDKLVLYWQVNSLDVTGAVLVRIDKSMNFIKWSRLIGNSLIADKFLIDGNTVVMAGGSAILPLGGSVSGSFITKIDGEAGTIISSNAFLDPGSYSTAYNIYKSGNGYLIVGVTNDVGNVNGANKQYYIRLTADLHIQAAKQFAELLPNVNPGAYRLLPESDGSFYGVYGEDFNVTLFKVNSNDSIVWIKRQPNNMSNPADLQQNGDGLFITGEKDSYNVVTGVSESNIFFSKSDFNGNLIGCPSLLVDEIKAVDLPFTESQLNLASTNYPVTLTTPGTMVSHYPLDVSLNCVSATQVHFSLQLPSDTLICQDDTLQIQAVKGFTNYQWSPLYDIRINNGGTHAVIYAGKDTSYVLSAQNGPGCIVLDTLHVKLKPQPVVNLGPDTVLCEGAVKQLIANYTGATYLWQDGSVNSGFQADHQGTYSVVVNLNGCLARDAIEIQYQNPPEINLEKEAILCKGQQLILHPTINNTSDYTWQDGSTQPTFTVKEAGLYALTAENFCGTAKDSIWVKGDACEIFMPSAFTPNHDGVNDVFRVGHPFLSASFILKVFNRWGQKVFETADISRGWDGTIDGQDSPSGGYAWFIDVKFGDGRSQRLRGTVILIR